MSDEYRGPERRMTDDDRDRLIRIDERTLHMAEEMKKLATVERVQAVEGRVDRHISSHVTKGGLFAAWAGTAVAAGLGLVGIFWK
jgi:hypothetical protein